MPHYETIFEDGSYSVANYDDDEEALGAVTAHHERATKGEPALLDSDGRLKAVRIVKLIKYDDPPGDLLESQTLAEDQAASELKTALADATNDGVTDLRQLAANIRNLSNPFVDSPPHESNYKANGKEVALPWQS